MKKKKGKTAGGYFHKREPVPLEMFLHNILRWNRLMCKHSKQSGCDEIREICLGSNRRGTLRYNKVLSAGNLISSDVANALCQKRLRLMLAWPRPLRKKKKKSWVDWAERGPARHIHPPATLTPQPRSREPVTFTPLPPFEGVGRCQGLVGGLWWSSPRLLVQCRFIITLPHV